MKIDKNNLTYSNEHPKGKKLSKDKVKKLKQYASNGAVGDKFMQFYNHYRNMGALPESAFNAAQSAVDNLDE